MVGREFAAAAVAAGVAPEVPVVEARSTALARRGEWADGPISTRYEFLRVVYRETCYERSLLSRPYALASADWDTAGTGSGPRARELATELAAHLVRGRDTGRAVPYLQVAGENALRRSAHRRPVNI